MGLNIGHNLKLFGYKLSVLYNLYTIPPMFTESVVPSSGVFNVKLPVSEMGLGITLTSKSYFPLSGVHW